MRERRLALASRGVDPSQLFGGISSLARPVDIRHASNRFALLAAVVGLIAGAVATLLLTELGVLASFGRGIAYGVGTFLTWAVARELHPDAPAAARYGVFAYAVAAWTGPPALAATVAALLTARVVARTPGRAPTRWDLAAVVVIAGVAAAAPVGFVVALGLAYALYVDTRLPDAGPTQDQHLTAAATALVAVVVTLASGSFWTDWRGPDVLEALVVLAALATMTVFRVGPLSSTGDLDRQPLHPERVVHARRLTLGAAMAAILWAGADGVGALAPVLAAFIGVGLAAVRDALPAPDPRTG